MRHSLLSVLGVLAAASLPMAAQAPAAKPAPAAATSRTAKAKPMKWAIRGGAAMVICADCDSRRAQQPCERALNTFIIVPDRDIDFSSVHTGRTRSSNLVIRLGRTGGGCLLSFGAIRGGKKGKAIGKQ